METIVAYALIVKEKDVLIGRKPIYAMKRNETTGKMESKLVKESGWTLPRVRGNSRKEISHRINLELKDQTGLDVLIMKSLGESSGPGGPAVYILFKQKDETQVPIPGKRFVNLEYKPLKDLFETYLGKKGGPGYLAPEEVRKYCLKPSSPQ